MIVGAFDIAGHELIPYVYYLSSRSNQTLRLRRHPKCCLRALPRSGDGGATGVTMRGKARAIGRCFVQIGRRQARLDAV